MGAETAVCGERRRGKGERYGREEWRAVLLLERRCRSGGRRVARLSREGDGRQLFSAGRGYSMHGRRTDHCRIRHGEQPVPPLWLPLTPWSARTSRGSLGGPGVSCRPRLRFFVTETDGAGYLRGMWVGSPASLFRPHLFISTIAWYLRVSWDALTGRGEQGPRHPLSGAFITRNLSALLLIMPRTALDACIAPDPRRAPASLRGGFLSTRTS